MAVTPSADPGGLLPFQLCPEGHVELDPSGKANGRGAYLCAEKDCFTAARLQRRLDHAPKVSLRDDDYDRLARDFDELLASRNSQQGR